MRKKELTCNKYCPFEGWSRPSETIVCVPSMVGVSYGLLSDTDDASAVNVPSPKDKGAMKIILTFDIPDRWYTESMHALNTISSVIGPYNKNSKNREKLATFEI